MRFAIEQDVRFIVGNNLARMAKLVDYAQVNGIQICDDIENGSISEHISMDENLRHELSKGLSPNSNRANELRALLKGDISFTPANYWPNLGIISCWLSGSVGVWVDNVKPLFGSKPLYFDYGFGASEGKFNIPNKPNNSAGILAIHSAFYEFIPYGENTNITLLAHELEIGKEYEMIITNFAGLYRYQMFDIIRVEGFYKNTPEIVFVSKSGDVGDLVGERLAGSVVSRVVEDIFAQLDVVIEFACAVTIQSPPHYIFCVETVNKEVDIDLHVVAQKIDIEFRKEVGYNLMRRDNLLSNPELRLMKKGWTELLYKRKTKGASRSQIKLPIIYKEEIPEAEYLLKNS